VGGSKAKLGQFPWQAQILTVKPPNDTPTFTCGGSLISDELILTAAHCIHYTDPERYIVIMGRQYVNAKDELCQGYEQRYKVVDLVVHPQFNKRHLTNDIAVMWIRSEKYNQTVRYSDQVLPVCLPELSNPMEEFYKNGDFGIVSGWGLLNETDNKGSNSLQHVALPMLSPDKCLEAYGRFVDMDENKQFCAGNDQGQDACAGDSGGPFVVVKEDQPGQDYLVGVVSYGRGCARPEYPGVYTKVYHYLPWINGLVGERKRKTNFPPSNLFGPSLLFPTTPMTTTSTTTSTATTTTTAKTTTTTVTTTTTTTTTTPAPTTPPPEVTVKSTSAFCSNQYSLLRCTGSKSITITRAVFAIDKDGHCGQNQRIDRSVGGGCSLENAEVVPKHMCDGKRNCWVYHNLFHRDPCPTKVKYSVINYICE